MSIVKSQSYDGRRDVIELQVVRLDEEQGGCCCCCRQTCTCTQSEQVSPKFVNRRKRRKEKVK